MSEYFKLTADILGDMQQYMPMARKMAYVKTYANACVESEDANGKAIATPTINPFMREMILSGVLLQYYLGLLGVNNDDKPSALELTTAQYDYFMHDNIWVQLANISTTSIDIRTKTMFMKKDYEIFAEMLDTEIDNVLAQKYGKYSRKAR